MTGTIERVSGHGSIVSVVVSNETESRTVHCDARCFAHMAQGEGSGSPEGLLGREVEVYGEAWEDMIGFIRNED